MMQSAGILQWQRSTADGVYNFATGKQSKVLDVIQAISHLMDTQIETEVLGNPEGEIKNQCLDWSKAREGLGWMPENDINNRTAKDGGMV